MRVGRLGGEINGPGKGCMEHAAHMKLGREERRVVEY
jgi:hypothetical protein